MPPQSRGPKRLGSHSHSTPNLSTIHPLEPFPPPHDLRASTEQPSSVSSTGLSDAASAEDDDVRSQSSFEREIFSPDSTSSSGSSESEAENTTAAAAAPNPNTGTCQPGTTTRPPVTHAKSAYQQQPHHQRSLYNHSSRSGSYLGTTAPSFAPPFYNRAPPPRPPPPPAPLPLLAADARPLPGAAVALPAPSLGGRRNLSVGAAAPPSRLALIQAGVTISTTFHDTAALRQPACSPVSVSRQVVGKSAQGGRGAGSVSLKRYRRLPRHAARKELRYCFCSPTVYQLDPSSQGLHEVFDQPTGTKTPGAPVLRAVRGLRDQVRAVLAELGGVLPAAALY